MFNNKKQKKKEFSLFDLDGYYLKKKSSIINSTIKNQVKRNKSVVYGARALNEHLPPHLQKHTRDWDVFSKKPLQSAKQLEKALDKIFNGDYFKVEQARHKGTYKVISNVTGKTIADFTKSERKVLSVMGWDGIDYHKISQIEDKLKRIIADPSKEFRHEKDKEALMRIKLYKKIHGGDNA